MKFCNIADSTSRQYLPSIKCCFETEIRKAVDYYVVQRTIPLNWHKSQGHPSNTIFNIDEHGEGPWEVSNNKVKYKWNVSEHMNLVQNLHASTRTKIIFVKAYQSPQKHLTKSCSSFVTSLSSFTENKWKILNLAPGNMHSLAQKCNWLCPPKTSFNNLCWTNGASIPDFLWNIFDSSCQQHDMFRFYQVCFFSFFTCGMLTILIRCPISSCDSMSLQNNLLRCSMHTSIKHRGQIGFNQVAFSLTWT